VREIQMGAHETRERAQKQLDNDSQSNTWDFIHLFYNFYFYIVKAKQGQTKFERRVE